MMPKLPPGRRLLRALGGRLPLIVWVTGAVAAAWLFTHQEPRSQGVATAEISDVRVTAEIAGRILRLAVQEGQAVKEGDALAVLDSGDLDDRIERCRAILSQAREREAQDEIKLYDLKLADLLSDRQRCMLCARVAGRVESLTCRVGEWVGAGSEVAVLQAGRAGRLTAVVSDSRQGVVARGTRALLKSRAKGGVTVGGRVVKVDSRLEPVPERLRHEVSSLEGRARTVIIELDRLADFAPAEIYDVHFVH
jgi:multidrug resistance efflux pump